MSRRSIGGVRPTFATHFPSLSRGHDLNQNIYMFVEDVQLGLMPIGGRTERHKEFAVSLAGGGEDRAKAEQLIGQIGQYDQHDLAEMVCDAIEEIARHLAWEGYAVYELVRSDDGMQHIWGFTPKRLWRLPGCFLQVIPRGDWNLWKKKVIVVPTKRVWCVEIPAELGGRRGYQALLRRLGRFEHIGPVFWRKDLLRGVQSRDFDLQRYVRNSEVYYGQVTKPWGWNRRDYSQERCTEFFTFYKLLRFSWAQAILREHIVGELNRLFARLGIRCELQVNGLPTPEEIRQTERELSEGSITFGAAADRVRL